MSKTTSCSQLAQPSSERIWGLPELRSLPPIRILIKHLANIINGSFMHIHTISNFCYNCTARDVRILAKGIGEQDFAGV